MRRGEQLYVIPALVVVIAAAMAFGWLFVTHTTAALLLMLAAVCVIYGVSIYIDGAD